MEGETEVKSIRRRDFVKVLSAGAAGLAGSCMGLPALAQQDYPSRPVRMFVPIAPGGLTDTLARTIGAGLAERLGQPVVIENRPGGGGVIGMQAAARSPADGYALAFVYQGVASVNPVLLKNPPYQTMRDFVPVALVAQFPLVLVVNPEVKASNVREFIDLARSGQVNYGSAGNATTSHLAMELFKRRAGVDLLHVPYKGESPAMTGLVGGSVAALFATPTVAMSMIQAGRVRALGISTAQRSALLPDLPTVAEGGLPDFAVSGWYGILAPAGTPAAIVDRVSRELSVVLKDADLRAKLAQQGIEPMWAGPEDAGTWLRNDTEKWRRVIAESGISVD